MYDVQIDKKMDRDEKYFKNSDLFVSDFYYMQY